MKINKDKLTIDFLLPAVLMITMVIVVFTQIIFRLMRNPLSWPDELSRWLLIWITFAGTSYCFKNGGLISVDFFVNKYFKESKRYFDIMSSVITCVLSLIHISEPTRLGMISYAVF